jgi:hypothetical protein
MDVSKAFDRWWGDSFPMAPANRQARENYIAFGGWLLNETFAAPEVMDRALLAFWDEALKDEPLDSPRRMAAALNILLKPAP